METSCKNLVKENMDLKKDATDESSQKVAYSDLNIMELPDSLFLHIFSFLPFSAIGGVAQTCRRWREVSSDELLWKNVFLHFYKLPTTTVLPQKANSWRSEFERLQYHTPCMLSESRIEHNDEVLHVSFSHDGTMFATCSKDGFFKVWECTQPCRLLFEKDMMSSFSWKYTQFSQFNETDTCLLVSGVYFGSMSTSGEIAVFNLQDDFNMQCRVTNKPYDVFGAWYDNEHLLSGTLYWTGDLNSVSAVWLSKASQQVESETESVSMVLYRFENINSSSIRLLHVAEVGRYDKSELVSVSTKADHAGASSFSCAHVNKASLERSLEGGDLRERQPMDKLLERSITEDEFDLENEDDTDENFSDSEEHILDTVGNYGDIDNQSGISAIVNLSSEGDVAMQSPSVYADDSPLRKKLLKDHLSMSASDSVDPNCLWMNSRSQLSVPSSVLEGERSRLFEPEGSVYHSMGDRLCEDVKFSQLVHDDSVGSPSQLLPMQITNDVEAGNPTVFKYLSDTSLTQNSKLLPHQITSTINDNTGFPLGVQSSFDSSADTAHPLPSETFRQSLSRHSLNGTGDNCFNKSQDGVCLFTKEEDHAKLRNTTDSEGTSVDLPVLAKHLAGNAKRREEEEGSDSEFGEFKFHSLEYLEDGAASSSLMDYVNMVNSCSNIYDNTIDNSNSESDEPSYSDSMRFYESFLDNYKPSYLREDSDSSCCETTTSAANQAELCMDEYQINASQGQSSGNQNNNNDNNKCLEKKGLANPGSSPSCKLMDSTGTQTEDSTSRTGSFQSLSQMSQSSSLSRDLKKGLYEKLLIYTWGSETYIPHKIGIKRMKQTDFCKGEMTARQPSMLLPDVMMNLHNGGGDRREVPDVAIEMHGHIVGLSISPDQRYLYVNCRAWPKNYIISDPQESPPLAQEVEISTIDLTTFQFVGPVLRSHKAYTHSDECFFLNLDVSDHYVVSGAEDKRGYIWDRHYGVPLHQFPHHSVVNCVALSPNDPEIAVSVSDDHTFKVWMSKNRAKEMKKKMEAKKTGSPIQNKQC